jgi:hypothetical protein
MQVLENELDRAISAYDDFKRRPPPRAGIADPQPYVDAIANRKEAIARYKRTNSELTTKLQDPQVGTAVRLAAMKKRMAAYVQGEAK